MAWLIAAGCPGAEGCPQSAMTTSLAPAIAGDVAADRRSGQTEALRSCGHRAGDVEHGVRTGVLGSGQCPAGAPGGLRCTAALGRGTSPCLTNRRRPPFNRSAGPAASMLEAGCKASLTERPAPRPRHNGPPPMPLNLGDVLALARE